MVNQNWAKFHLANLESTQKFGQSIGQMAQAHTLLALAGEVGSGKTTLVKAIAKALGVVETVTSPTFVMLNEYRTGRLPLFHLDLYRLYENSGEKIPFDLISGQLDEILNTKSIIIIEWPNIFLNASQNELHNLGENGYLSLELQADKQNDHARILTIKNMGANDNISFLLLEKLCKLAKDILV